MAVWIRRMMEISFYRGHPPFRPPLRIDSIALSGTAFVSGTDVFVGLISVYMSTQPFTGTLAVGGADAASFKIVGSNLVTNGTVIAGTYSITLIATQATANNSPFTSPIFTIIGSPTQDFTSVGLSNSSFVPTGSAPVTVGNVSVVLNPVSPPSTATISFDGGTNDALFQLTNGGVLPCALQAKSGTSVGNYTVRIKATQAGIGGSPFSSGNMSLTGLPAFVSLGLSSTNFAPNGISAADVGNVVVTMNPGAPPSTATISFDGGTNDSLFQLSNGGALPCILQAKPTTGSGDYTIRLKATQAGIANSPFSSGNISLNGGTLSVTVVPSTSITIPSTTPLGATVATLQGVWSNGVAFTGSYAFVAPNFDNGGIYAITLNVNKSGNLIVNPSGPGVGPQGGSVNHVNIEALQ